MYSACNMQDTTVSLQITLRRSEPSHKSRNFMRSDPRSFLSSIFEKGFLQYLASGLSVVDDRLEVCEKPMQILK